MPPHREKIIRGSWYKPPGEQFGDGVIIEGNNCLMMIA
jgi:hypothetical protein